MVTGSLCGLTVATAYLETMVRCGKAEEESENCSDSTRQMERLTFEICIVITFILEFMVC